MQQKKCYIALDGRYPQGTIPCIYKDLEKRDLKSGTYPKERHPQRKFLFQRIRIIFESSIRWQRRLRGFFLAAEPTPMRYFLS